MRQYLGTSAPAVPGRVCLKFLVKVMMGKMDYYRILGLPETADTEAVKRAYRRMVKGCHPDAHPGDKNAEERFKQITEAYAVLSDAEKREKYDSERAGATRGQKAAAGGQSGGQPFGPEGFRGGFEDFFSFMGGQPKQNRTGKQETDKNKQEAKRNPIDTSGLFERYMGFK